MTTPVIRQVWECDKCGYRTTTPIRAIEITCINKHSHGRHTAIDLVWPLTLIWDKADGGPMPETEVRAEGRA